MFLKGAGATLALPTRRDDSGERRGQDAGQTGPRLGFVFIPMG
jgi:hypothetical protein